ncbi:MAG: DUF6541 family protein [Jatrophihabitans sp.]
MLTALVALALAVVPGGLLGYAIPAGRLRWAVWSAAPILTLGLTSIGMGWLGALGLPDGIDWVLGAELLLAGVSVAIIRLLVRRAARRGDGTGTLVAPPSTRVLALAGVARSGASLPDTSSLDAPPPTGTPATRVRTGSSWRRRLPRPGAALPSLTDLVAFAVPAAITVGFGEAIIGRFREPAGWDAMNHAILTRNIIDSGSTAIDSVCTTGSTAPVVACHFYPLAADVSWAQATSLAGGTIGRAMLAWSVLIGPLALVAAIYAAARILGARPAVASAAAVAPAVLGPLWASMRTGRPPEEYGPGLSVAVALLILLALRSKHPVRLGVLAGLGTGGLLMTHTYEVLFAGVLALGFVFALPGRPQLRTVLGGAAATFASTFVVIIPYLGALLGANSERSGNPNPNPSLVGQWDKSWQFWVSDFQRYVLFGYPGPGGPPFHSYDGLINIGLLLTAPCLLASPLCLVFRQLRWARPWLLAGLVWTAVGIWTSVSHDSAALFLVGLWYGVLDRLRVMILPVYGVVAVAGACSIALSLRWLWCLLLRRSRELDASRWLSPAALLLVVPLLVLGAAPSTRAPLRHDLAQRTLHGDAYPRVFAWLKTHLPNGKVVAYDHNLEFITWSHADYRVPALFGITGLTRQGAADTTKRFQAFRWLAHIADAPPNGGCLVRKYGVYYFVVGQARVPGRPATYGRRTLARSPRVDLVHQDGGLKVYRVNAVGTACPGS